MTYNVVDDTIKAREKAEVIRQEVTELMANSLELFSFENIIDCSDELTPEEKEWAKENLDWSVNLVDPHQFDID